MGSDWLWVLRLRVTLTFHWQSETPSAPHRDVSATENEPCSPATLLSCGGPEVPQRGAGANQEPGTAPESHVCWVPHELAAVPPVAGQDLPCSTQIAAAVRLVFSGKCGMLFPLVASLLSGLQSVLGAGGRGVPAIQPPERPRLNSHFTGQETET